MVDGTTGYCSLPDVPLSSRTAESEKRIKIGEDALNDEKKRIKKYVKF